MLRPLVQAARVLGLTVPPTLLAPAGSPPPIVDKLNGALHAALADPKAQKTFADGGMDPFPPAEGTPEAASTLLKSEVKLWGDVIRANNISAQ